jgi:hypothetical protein
MPVIAPNEWASLSIAGLWDGYNKWIQDAQAKINNFQNFTDSIKKQMDDRLATANAMVDFTQSMLASLGASGISILLLDPQSGGFFTRAQNAPGAKPPNNPNNYSGGSIIAFEYPDLATVTDKYNQMIKALTGKMTLPEL